MERGYFSNGKKSIEDRKINHEDGGESGKSSVSRAISSSEVSDSNKSSCSSFRIALSKPNKANDARWVAICVDRSKEGALGLNHFLLLKRLGCGDIGSV